MEYLEESNLIPVVDTYDVIVVGGGIAGVAAAVAAKRNGSRVLLIEKSVVLGGLATLGFIAYYLPLCDGKAPRSRAPLPRSCFIYRSSTAITALPDEWRDGKGIGTKQRYTTIFFAPGIHIRPRRVDGSGRRRPPLRYGFFGTHHGRRQMQGRRCGEQVGTHRLRSADVHRRIGRRGPPFSG